MLRRGWGTRLRLVNLSPAVLCSHGILIPVDGGSIDITVADFMTHGTGVSAMRHSMAQSSVGVIVCLSSLWPLASDTSDPSYPLQSFKLHAPARSLPLSSQTFSDVATRRTIPFRFNRPNYVHLSGAAWYGEVPLSTQRNASRDRPAPG
jgi:hypothetical protein